MSSRSPSPSVLSRHLFPNSSSLDIKNMRIRLLEGLNAMPQGSRPTLNPQSDTVTQNRDARVYRVPIGRPQHVICEINVKGYNLEDLTVTLENGYIVIRGNHGEKRDEYSLVSRKFTRRILNPMRSKDDINVHLFTNGMLSITGNKWPKSFELPIRKSFLNKTNLVEMSRVSRGKQMFRPF